MVHETLIWKVILLASACTGVAMDGVEKYLSSSEERADCPYVQLGNQCLLFVNFQNDSYNAAQALCQGFGGNLVVIKTATQLKTIMDYMYTEGDTSNSYWIDGMLKSDTGSFTFSSGELMPMGTPFWSSSYTLHEPSGDGPCTELYWMEHHYLNDKRCEHIDDYPLCEFPFSSANEESEEMVQEVACEAPFTAVGDMCLTFLTHEHMSWEEAVVTCRLLGGHLAMFDDIEMLRSIYLHIHEQKFDNESFWLGGSDMVMEGTWLWTNGNPIPMGSPFWGTSAPAPWIEPNWNTALNCLGLQAAGKHYFRAVDCQTLQYPLCMAT